MAGEIRGLAGELKGYKHGGMTSVVVRVLSWRVGFVMLENCSKNLNIYTRVTETIREKNNLVLDNVTNYHIATVLEIII